MSEEPEPKLIRDDVVVCRGPADAPHPPQRLALPANRTVVCNLCGQYYRRASDRRQITGAHWPKAE